MPLSRLAHQLAALAQLHRAARVLDAQRVLHLARQLMHAVLGAEESSIFQPGATIGSSSLCAGALQLGLLDHAAAIGMTVRVPPFPAIGADGRDHMARVRSMLCVPAVADEGTPSARTLAVLVMVNPQDSDTFSTADERFATLLAMHVADALALDEARARAQREADGADAAALGDETRGPGD